jgi:hypothetical protein
MLSSPVYTKSHPGQIAAFASRMSLRDAAHAASCTSSVFSNSFLSYSFRTLASHFQATVSSNSLEIKRFRTLCKIPGIGYPFTQSGLCEGFTQLAPSFDGSALREGPVYTFPPTPFLDRLSIRSPLLPAIHPFSLQPFAKCSSRNSFILTTIHFHGGCIPPLKRNAFPQAVAVPLRSNRNALISLLFLPLRTFSFTTRGGTPPPVQESCTKMKLEPASLPAVAGLPVAQAHRTLKLILPRL